MNEDRDILVDVFRKLCDEWDRVAILWATQNFLYEENRTRAARLFAVGGRFFRMMERVIQESLIMSICRMTSRPKRSFKTRDEVFLRRICTDRDHEERIKRAEEYVIKSGIRQVRNQIIGHHRRKAEIIIQPGTYRRALELIAEAIIHIVKPERRNLFQWPESKDAMDFMTVLENYSHDRMTLLWETDPNEWSDAQKDVSARHNEIEVQTLFYALAEKHPRDELLSEYLTRIDTESQQVDCGQGDVTPP